MLAVATLVVLAAPAFGQGEQTRREIMDFSQCLALIDEVAEELGSNPTSLLRTRDVRIIRIDAPDGAVILTCNRVDNTMVLARKAGLRSGS
jgi:hypothetical protein